MLRWILIGLLVFSGAVAANPHLQFIDDESAPGTQSGFGARGAHWQPGQIMLVFWLPDVDEFIYAVGNITSNVTQAKLQVWVKECEIRSGLRCRIHNLVWLDNPRKVGPIER